MPSQRSSRWLLAVLAAAMIVPTIVFVASAPWLKQQQALAFLAAGVTATVVIGAAFTLSVIVERKQDEWVRSGSRFASQWGGAIGTGLVAVLLVPPPIRDTIVSLITGMIDDGPRREYKTVILAFTLGFCTLAVAQALCAVAVNIAWSIRMSRPARDAS